MSTSSVSNPTMTETNGHKAWLLNGEIHREDGPAYEIEIHGYKAWYLKGKLHREDGPAIEFANRKEMWYLNGKNISEEEHASQTTLVKSAL
jgi:hypothetical protein